MASELDLNAIEQRANAATEGPWDFWIRLTPDVSRVLVGTHDKPTLSGALPQVAVSMEIAKLPTRINPSGSFMHNRDAEFIAHARSDIPALIKRVRELEAIIVRNCADRCDVSDHVSIERRKNGYVVYVDGFNGADRITYFPDVLAAIDAATLAAKGLADGK